MDTRASVTGPGPVVAPVAEVLSWGANDTFQLGSGSGDGRDVPGPVLLPQRATLAQLAAGNNFGLVLTTTGLVWAWGANTYGQLGTNSTDWSDHAVPVQLSLPETESVTAIAAGAAHGMALTSNGDVYTWGSNKYGQLGIGDTGVEQKLTPVQVKIPWAQLGLPETTTVTAIAAGSAHCLALTSTQQLLAWGHNSKGQLGNNDTGLADQFSPVLVQLPAQVRVADIAGGRDHSLAITTTDSVLAWGSNFRGQLGNPQAGSHSVIPVPVQLTPEEVVIAITAGLYHSLARTADGSVLSWGDNQAGQLGNPTVEDHSDVPVPVTLPDGITVNDIAACGNHSLALTSTAEVLSWGANEAGQLGDGSTGDNRSSPVWVKLPPGMHAHSVAGGSYFSVAMVTAAPKLAWGYNASGQLGDNSTQDSSDPVYVHVPDTTEFIDIKAGFNHSLAATDTGLVLAWGANSKGQLGLGEPGNRLVPYKAVLPEDVIAVAVAAGGAHSLALTTTGDIYAWGLNNAGQLGLDDDKDRNGPVKIRRDIPGSLPSDVSVVAIAAYNLHSLALLENGQVFAWGDNSRGQLGVGDTRQRLLPTQVQLPDGVTVAAIAAGGAHSLAITSTGDALAWGWNQYGQLGDNTRTQRLTPVSVELDGAKLTAIAGGQQHSLAISVDQRVGLITTGRVLAWGDNSAGALGAATTTTNQLTPVAMDFSEANLAPETGFVDLAGGMKHSVVVSDTGTIVACGDNAYGQLGDGTKTPRPLPVPVKQPTGTTASAVTAGQFHTLAR